MFPVSIKQKRTVWVFTLQEAMVNKKWIEYYLEGAQCLFFYVFAKKNIYYGPLFMYKRVRQFLGAGRLIKKLIKSGPFLNHLVVFVAHMFFPTILFKTDQKTWGPPSGWAKVGVPCCSDETMGWVSCVKLFQCHIVNTSWWGPCEQQKKLCGSKRRPFL